MPTYDYACKACGHRFEEFQSISADALRKCPACKKLKLERLIGAGAGIIFKGSGFYQTDYRSAGYASDAKKDSDSSSSDSGSGTTGAACSPKCGTDDAPSGCQLPKAKTEAKKSKSNKSDD